MLARLSKASLLSLQKRVFTRTFIATPVVKDENDRPWGRRPQYSNSGSRHEGHRSFQPRGNDSSQSVCHKCGSPDHFIKECPERQKVTCFKCGQDGHIARDCTELVQNERVVTCYNCGEEGHIARMCPREKLCNNCGQAGHQFNACPEPAKSREDHLPQSRRSDDREEGFGARQYERRPKMDRRWGIELSNVNGGDEHAMRAQARDESEVTCWHCHEKGHSSRNCPSKPADSCWNCGGEGHRSHDCPLPRKDGGQRSTGGGRGGYRGVGGGGRGGSGRRYAGRTSDRGWEGRRSAGEGELA